MKQKKLKPSINVREESNLHRIGLELQHGRRDVMR